MKRAALALGLGLSATAVWLCTAFIAGSSSHLLKFLWHTAVSPAMFIKSSVLPPEAAAFVFGRESQGAHTNLLAVLTFAVWWSFTSVCIWLWLRLAGAKLRPAAS